MPKPPPTVDAYLAALEHPRKAEIEALRAIVRGADPAIAERVKWNAPSFGPGDEDRVTMRLHPKACLQLVFHRGAKAKDPTGFAFEDPSGLLAWQAADRAVVDFAQPGSVEARREAVQDLVRRWIAAT